MATKPTKPTSTTSRKTARKVEAPRIATAEEPADRTQRIAEAAYYLAAARGFAPGNELDDWLAAERAIDQQPS